jgi:hypothetical protein
VKDKMILKIGNYKEKSRQGYLKNFGKDSNSKWFQFWAFNRCFYIQTYKKEEGVIIKNV